MTKRMTLNELARMVANGFSEMQEYMDGRFDVLENRVGTVEGRMGTLETEVRGTNQRIDQIVSTLDDHSYRIKNLEIAAQ